MNFRKKLSKLSLLTALLLGGACAHGMEGLSQEPYAEVQTVKASPLTGPQNPLPEMPWADLARKVCPFLDTPSFGRFQQVNRCFRAGAHLYLEHLPKGEALIDHLRTMPAAQGFAYLSVYAQHDLDAAEHFLDAFYTYLDVPQEDRLFRIAHQAVLLNLLRSSEDFTCRVSLYAPYGMCLIAHYFLNPQDYGWQKRVRGAFMEVKDEIPWTPLAQAHSYLFLIPYGEEKLSAFYSQAAIEVMLGLNEIWATPQACAREERKALHRSFPRRLQALFLHQTQMVWDEEMTPIMQQRFFPLSLWAGALLQAKGKDFLHFEKLEKNLGIAYQNACSDGYNALRLQLLDLWKEVQNELFAAYRKLGEDCFYEAGELTDPVERATRYTLAAAYYEAALQKSGDSAMAKDYEHCGASHLNAAQNLVENSTKAIHFKWAAFYYGKALREKGDAATAEDEENCRASHENAALNLTDSAERVMHFKKAVSHTEKVSEKLGDAADAQDWRRFGVSYFNAAQSLTDLAEKAAHFKRAAWFFEHVLQKEGEAATAQDYEVIAMSYHNAAYYLTDPGEKILMSQRAEELRQMKAQKFPDEDVSASDSDTEES